MGNVPEWAAVLGITAVTAAIGVGVARAKMETLVKKVDEMDTRLQRLNSMETVVKKVEEIDKRVEGISSNVDCTENKVIKNQPVLDHLHGEAFKTRERLEQGSKDYVSLVARLTALQEKSRDTKEDLNKYVGSVKHDFEKTVADVYKHLDSLKADVNSRK